MALSSPLPTFLEFNYDSKWGNHRAIIPTVKVVSVGTVGFQYGIFHDEDNNPLGTGAGEVGSYVQNFAQAFVNVLPGEGRAKSWSLWQVPDVAAWLSGANRDQMPEPITGGSFAAVVSTGAITHWTSKAVQWTLTFNCNTPRSTFRLQIMNACMNAVELNANLAGRAEKTALINQVVNVAPFIRSRKGGKPVGLAQDSVTLNEKLRRTYRMV